MNVWDSSDYSRRSLPSADSLPPCGDDQDLSVHARADNLNAYAKLHSGGNVTLYPFRRTTTTPIADAFATEECRPRLLAVMHATTDEPMRLAVLKRVARGNGELAFSLFSENPVDHRRVQ